jgi:hypothetical protein
VTDDQRLQRLALASRIGTEFVRLGMRKHVAQIRAYYRTVRAGREPGEGEWTDDLVVGWAQNLRIEPHERDVPVKPRQSSCGCPSPRTFTVLVWPGGSRHTCGACHANWIEVD